MSRRSGDSHEAEPHAVVRPAALARCGRVLAAHNAAIGRAVTYVAWIQLM